MEAFDLNQINFYQLENLIIQRVPFKFICFVKKKDILAVFSYLNSYYLNFLNDQIEEFSSENDFVAKYSESDNDKSTPIIILSADGLKSQYLKSNLDQLKFLNYFWVKGGLFELSEIKKNEI